MRLFQVAHDPRCAKGGVYWSWNGGPREGRGAEALEKGGQIGGGGGAGGGWDSIYENDQSDKVLNAETSANLWKYSTLITGAAWPDANQPKSPCPTLKVVGAITDIMNRKEEAKRMAEEPGMVAGKGIVISAGVARVADAVADRTVFRLLRGVQRLVLGKVPDAARDGSFQETKAARTGRTGGLVGLVRRGPFRKRSADAVVDVTAAAEEEGEEEDLDPEAEAKARIREELEVELRNTIKARNAESSAEVIVGAVPVVGDEKTEAPASPSTSAGGDADAAARNVTMAN